MGRHTRLMALMLALPIAFAAACGGDDEALDRSALEQDELDRELELALQGDSVPATFEDTAVAEPDAAPATEQPAPPAARTPRPRPAPTPAREAEPEAERPAPQRPRTVTRSVPTGTTFAIRMDEQLSTATSKAGDAFTATLADPIVDADGNVIVPAGARVRGRVTAVSPSGRVGQTAALKLAFEAVSFGGESYPLQASVERADVQRASRTSAGESAGKVAAGAAAGAILGRVLGGDTEATLAGAAIGAAAGTAIAMGTSDVDAVLPAGAEVVIRLDQPITITRTVAG